MRVRSIPAPRRAGGIPPTGSGADSPFDLDGAECADRLTLRMGRPRVAFAPLRTGLRVSERVFERLASQFATAVATVAASALSPIPSHAPGRIGEPRNAPCKCSAPVATS